MPEKQKERTDTWVLHHGGKRVYHIVTYMLQCKDALPVPETLKCSDLVSELQGLQLKSIRSPCLACYNGIIY